MAGPTNDGVDTAALKQATVAGVRWMAIARITGEVVGLAAMVALARLVPPAAFGLFAIALLVQEVALTLTGEGIGTALVQRPHVERRHVRTALTLSAATGALLGLLVFLLAPLIFTPVFGGEVTALVQLSSPMFVLGALTAVPMALLQRRLDFRWLGLVQVASVAARALSSLGLALAGLEAEALVAGALAAAATTMIGTSVVGGLPLPGFELRAAREIASFGVPAAMSGLSWTAFRNVDFAVIGARLGALQAGFYWRGYQLGIEYQRKIGSAVNQVAFPIYSRASDRRELLELRRRYVRVETAVLIPLLATLVVLAPTLVPWLFGPVWEPAVVPTQILAAAGIATVLSDTMAPVMLAAGHPRAWLAYNFVTFVIYGAAVYVASGHGLTAACVAVLAVQTVSTVAAYGVLLRMLAPRPFAQMCRDVAPAGVSTAVMLAVAAPLSWLLANAGAPAAVHLACTAVAAGVTYLATVRTWFPATWHDFVQLARRVLDRGGGRARKAPLPGAASGMRMETSR